MRSTLELNTMTAAALEPSPASTSPTRQPSLTGRLASVDVFRGFVMMALALQGYFPGIAMSRPGNPIFEFLGRQFSHVDWQGMAFWDTIQPSFMFLVGVSMTFSHYSRRGRGDSLQKVAGHVLYRSLVLIALGIMLASAHSERTVWLFGEVLCQIGLAYPFAYLVVGRSRRTQLITGGAILIAMWLAFALYPVPGAGFDYSAIGLTADPGPYTGFFAHWNKYTSFAFAFDRWFINLFPQQQPFLANTHYGPTLNFVTSIVTLIFGVMAGDLLRSARPTRDKALDLVKAGAVSLALGLVAGFTICPIVKSIWTPSWVLVTGGVVLWYLALGIWLADLRGWTRPLFPFTVLGRNSLAIYLMLRLLKEPVRETVATHAAPLAGMPLYWTFEFFTVVLVLWLICYWMYRRKLFLAI